MDIKIIINKLIEITESLDLLSDKNKINFFNKRLIDELSNLKDKIELKNKDFKKFSSFNYNIIEDIEIRYNLIIKLISLNQTTIDYKELNIIKTILKDLISPISLLLLLEERNPYM